MTRELNISIRGGRASGKTVLLRAIAAYLGMRGIDTAVNDEAEQMTVTLTDGELDSLIFEQISRKRRGVAAVRKAIAEREE